jgi:hypothetical protein
MTEPTEWQGLCNQRRTGKDFDLSGRKAISSAVAENRKQTFCDGAHKEAFHQK